MDCGSQILAYIISMPQPDIALIQVPAIPLDNGGMVTGGRRASRSFSYQDMNALEWDSGAKLWRPKGTAGDRYASELFQRDVSYSWI